MNNGFDWKARPLSISRKNSSFLKAPHSPSAVADILFQYRNEVTPTKKGAEAETFRINAMLTTQLASVVY